MTGAPPLRRAAGHKRYRNRAVSQVLLEVLDEMSPRYPPREDLDGVVIE